jgi:hypothetical protein
MLGSHENIVVPPESLLFKMFWSQQRQYGDLARLGNQAELLKDMLATRVIRYWSPRPRLEDVVPLIRRPGFAGVIEALILSTAAGKTAGLWGEKSPGHIFYWQQIRQCFPEAKVVHIVRDGRDVAVSLLQARMGPKTYDAAARLWKSYLVEMDRVRSTCPAEDFCEIRYEDLLAEPEGTLRQVCARLGVHYSPAMLQFFEHKYEYRTDVTNAANLQRPLIASNTQKWRSRMGLVQLREFEAVAGDCLLRYGYALQGDGRTLPKARQAFIRYLYSPALRFIARAKDRQGQWEFLNLRAIRTRRFFKHFLNVRASG